MISARFLRMIASLLIAGCLCAVASACPTCKDSLADGNGGNLVDGFGWSIIFMMSMPFLILFSLAGYFYYEVRKARAAIARGERPPAPTFPLDSSKPVRVY